MYLYTHPDATYIGLGENDFLKECLATNKAGASDYLEIISSQLFLLQCVFCRNYKINESVTILINTNLISVSNL